MTPRTSMLLLLLFACMNTYTTPEHLLDPPDVVYVREGTGEASMTVTGSAEAWTLVDADGTWSLASPGRPDLAALDGVEGAVAVDAFADDDDAAAWPAGESVPYRSVTITTDSTVSYALSLFEPSADAPGAFGAGFARYGDELGTRKVDYWLLTIREIVFATDEGEIALAPAEPTVLTVAGERYLTTVLSAWESDVANEAVGQPKCGGIGDRFAYEMTRLPEGEEATTPEGLEGTGDLKAASSCG